MLAFFVLLYVRLRVRIAKAMPSKEVPGSRMVIGGIHMLERRRWF